MTSPTDKWVQSLCVADMWAPVNGQHRPGPNWTSWTWIRAGLWPTTWHAVALPCHCHGPPLGFVQSSTHTTWFTVDWRSRSMDRRLGLRWTESMLLPSSLVHVHRVQARAAGEGILCFLPQRAPTGDVLSGELLRRRWRPIEVGKSFTRPRRVRWWGQGGGQGFLGCWPRWSAARSWRCSPARHLGAVPGVLVPCFLSDI